MSCNFSIPFTTSAEQVLDKARTAIQSQGGDFSGDASGGSFGVSVFGNTIKGSYTILNNVIDINIGTKPFLVPCSTIESFLRSKIG